MESSSSCVIFEETIGKHLSSVNRRGTKFLSIFIARQRVVLMNQKSGNVYGRSFSQYERDPRSRDFVRSLQRGRHKFSTAQFPSWPREKFSEKEKRVESREAKKVRGSLIEPFRMESIADRKPVTRENRWGHGSTDLPWEDCVRSSRGNERRG